VASSARAFFSLISIWAQKASQFTFRLKNSE
jgi:hypothetical protein